MNWKDFIVAFEIPFFIYYYYCHFRNALNAFSWYILVVLQFDHWFRNHIFFYFIVRYCVFKKRRRSTKICKVWFNVLQNICMYNFFGPWIPIREPVFFFLIKILISDFFTFLNFFLIVIFVQSKQINNNIEAHSLKK